MDQTIKRRAFIIAHKYFRGYTSFLKYYIDNIIKFHPESLILVVDNNSSYTEDVFPLIEKNENVVLLTNNIDCKFELGAYQVGIKYLLDNNLLDTIDYVFMTQDTFVLKNKVDIESLKAANVLACPINSYYQDGAYQEISTEVLTRLGLNNHLDRMTFCWCCSLVIHTTKIMQFYNYITQIVITVRSQSEAAERYLARILFELNEHRNHDIDGDIRNLTNKYDCWKVDIINDNVSSYFAKTPQQKTEATRDR